MFFILQLIYAIMTHYINASSLSNNNFSLFTPRRSLRNSDPMSGAAENATPILGVAFSAAPDIGSEFLRLTPTMNVKFESLVFNCKF